MTRIGFIGLGAMGAPMARRLLAAGYPVSSCVNRSRDALEALLPLGLQELPGPAELGAVSDILCVAVWDAAQIDGVLRGPGGALRHMAPGATVLVMSTVAPDECRDLAAEASRRGVTLLDCALSGLPQGAATGTLTLMMGGDEADIAPLRPVLAHLGRVCVCGDVGAGQAVKLGNNAMVIATMGLLLELREPLRAQGVDFDAFLEVLNQSTGRSFVSEHIPMPPTPTAPHPMAQKDIALMLAVGQQAGQALPMLSACYRHTLEGA